MHRIVRGALAVALTATLACGGDDDTGAVDGSTARDGGARDGGSRPDGTVPFGDLAAFVGAEGFGTDTPGGRGGRVIIVTTLDWDGPGSFHEAITTPEPRIIVFAVSGVINVPEGASLDESMSYVTVAGQTSPGGVTFTGSYGNVLEAYHSGFHDGVFRFLRFRGAGNYDNISLTEVHHVVFDHCDFSGSTDETFDMTFSHDFTVQWSTIANSDPSGQNYGSLIAYPPTANVSWHHNLSAHHGGRCEPHMHWGEGVEGDVVVDFRNNVDYNCTFDALMYLDSPPGSDRISFNVVGNYAKAGPDTPATAVFFALSSDSSLYASDNVFPGHEVWSPFRMHTMLAAPVAAPPVTTQASDVAFDLVLRRAGAFPRDAMTARVADEAANGTGTFGHFDDALLSGGAAPPTDADMDGIADAWEMSHGLDPSNAADATADRDGDGYTNIEEYVNELADMLIPS